MSNVGKAEYVGMPLPDSKHGLVPANAESTQFSFDIYRSIVQSAGSSG